MKTPTKGAKERFPPGPRDEDATLVVLDSEPYVQFEAWMDGELDRLVARWIHSAAPNANRPSLLRNRSCDISGSKITGSEITGSEITGSET